MKYLPWFLIAVIIIAGIIAYNYYKKKDRSTIFDRTKIYSAPDFKFTSEKKYEPGTTFSSIEEQDQSGTTSGNTSTKNWYTTP